MYSVVCPFVCIYKDIHPHMILQRRSSLAAKGGPEYPGRPALRWQVSRVHESLQRGPKRPEAAQDPAESQRKEP